jgi:excisionase family DNA binding protein
MGKGSAAMTDSRIPLVSPSQFLPGYISDGLRPEKNNGNVPESESIPNPSPFTESDILFTEEAAVLLRATTQQTSEMARKGLIPAFKVGKRWRFSRKILLEWVEKASTKHLDLFSPSATVPTSPEPARTRPKKNKRKFPTDLSPTALREALRGGKNTPNEPASESGAQNNIERK